jgi:serine/threonine-protein kinase
MSDRAARIQEQLQGLYRIGKLLGNGGMGEVWAAREVELDRAVAIKILSTDLSRDPEFVARFRREAKTLAKFSNPRIVRILAIGTLGWEEREYMVMELLGGRTLRAHIDVLRGEGKVVDPVSAAFYGVQMLEGLGVAHAEGIIHRDVKPENMMLGPGGHLTLLDFGLAKAAEVTGRGRAGTTWPRPLLGPGAAPAGKTETRKSILLGTPRYMAPELIRDRTVDARSDLYAAGVVMATTLTGEYPYDVGAGDDASILRAHVEQAPVLRRENNPDCVPDLWDFVLRLLEKDPAARYQSAAEAEAALSSLLRASAPPEHPVARMWEQERRGRAHREVYEKRGAPARARESREVTATASARAADEVVDRTVPANRTVLLGKDHAPASPCADVTRPMLATVPRASLAAPFPLAKPRRTPVPDRAEDAEERAQAHERALQRARRTGILIGLLGPAGVLVIALALVLAGSAARSRETPLPGVTAIAPASASAAEVATEVVTTSPAPSAPATVETLAARPTAEPTVRASPGNTALPQAAKAPAPARSTTATPRATARPADRPKLPPIIFTGD